MAPTSMQSLKNDKEEVSGVGGEGLLAAPHMIFWDF